MTDPDTWNPARYLTYADERGRPFDELLARVAATRPDRVVDLGCGPGNLTARLAVRWPEADIEGVDSSGEMLQAARSVAGVRLTRADVRSWRPDRPVDVLVSNATFQWIPGHLDLLTGLVGQVVPEGWFAFSVPGNFEEPSHALRRDLAAEPAYAAHTRDVATPSAFDAGTYLEVLRGLGCRVDAWETTYLHVLTGPDPVLTWVSATGARPTLDALPADLRPEFERELGDRLARAYPVRDGVVVLPFRRVFVVARTPR